ncbi:unnamed protein product, partial [Didymodactylos carnosus]
SDGDLSKSIPKNIGEYPTPKHLRIKYITDEEEYAPSESLSFAIRTNQKEKTIVISCYSFENNVNYYFELENGRPKILFTHENWPDIILTSTSNLKSLNDDRWHRIGIERIDRKFRFEVDNIIQSEVQLPDIWQIKSNILVGAELIPAPNEDFQGKIGDMVVANMGRSLVFQEEAIDLEDDSPIQTSAVTTTITTTIPKDNRIFVLVDMDSETTISFISNDNDEVFIPGIKSDFDSFSLTFQTYLNSTILATLINEPYFIGLEIDIDGILNLIVHDHINSTSRLRLTKVNDGKEYTIELRNDRRKQSGIIEAWLNERSKQKNLIEINNPFYIKDIILGGRLGNYRFTAHNKFIGCISNPKLNLIKVNIADVAKSRRNCTNTFINVTTKQQQQHRVIDDYYVHESISFREQDRPLPFLFSDNDQREFKILSLTFVTFELNGILFSLADKLYDNFVTLSIRNGVLYVTFDNHVHKRYIFSLNRTVNDGIEHQIIIKNNQEKDYIELDKIKYFLSFNLVVPFYLNSIYFGQIDGFAKQHYDLEGENFVGCMKDVLFNEKPLIRRDQINDLSRLSTLCKLTYRPRKNVISYVSPDISFSMRDRRDIIELNVKGNDEFYYCQLPIKTTNKNAVISSMYSNEDNRGMVFYVKDGKFQLKYYPPNGKAKLLYSDNLTISDGVQHRVIVTRNADNPTVTSQTNNINHINENMYVQIDKRSALIPLPERSPLFFDVVTIGGPYRHIYDSDYSNVGTYTGCFANITYNRHPLLPEGVLKPDRYDCFYQSGMLCDRQRPCNLQPPSILPPSIVQASPSLTQFCGQTDCSMVCTPKLVDIGSTGLVRYISQIGPGQREQIDFTIYTNSPNSTLYIARDGVTQVSITIVNYSPKFLIQNGPSVQTYDFPGKLTNAQWHVLKCQKDRNSLNLTLDYQSKYYGNIATYFSLFGDRKIHICGTNYYGYVQDIMLLADSRRENVIQNCIRNPSLIEADPGVAWNVHAPIQAPCATVNCQNGGYCISAPTGPFCNCPTFYTGLRCESPVSVDPCISYPCGQGTCRKDRNQQPYCECYSGYTGSRCETREDPCARLTCNNGRCEADRGTAYCRCYTGWTGPDCATPSDICSRTNCNYGTCINEPNDQYRCECSVGYEGRNCERQVDPCLTHACYNQGVCIVQNGQPLCRCTYGYTGHDCS